VRFVTRCRRAFDLTPFGPRVREHAEEWSSLGLDWSVDPIHPNYGKALTWASFPNPRVVGSDLRLGDG
jgi:hypothetical protein